MGDRVSFYEESAWDNSEGTIVGFVCVNDTPCAVIRTVNGKYTYKPIEDLRYIS